jgi:Animal haem peroxidase
MPLPEEGAPDAPPSHGSEEPRGLDAVPRSHFLEGRFGRLFRLLTPFAPPDHLLIDLGKAGGPLQEAARPRAADNPDLPAGFTYLGQFVDHDTTFDPVSSFGRRHDPDALENFRTPRFDLDCLYLAGPKASPFLYEKRDPDRFLLERNRAGDRDLPRNSQQTALIGDPRNDENIIVSQLHVGFLSFHNALVALLRDRPRFRESQALPGETLFATAQRLARWHYQWTIANDFLPRIVGRQLVNQLLTRDPSGKVTIELDFYRPQRRPFIPVEFAVAAYRFGHTMVRPVYDLNDVIVNVNIFGRKGDHPLTHLGGSRRLPEGWPAKWPIFFRFPGRRASPQASRKINTKLARPLFDLPATVVSSRIPERRSLAVRNLLRGKALGLPSGQAVATAMGLTPRTNAQLGLSGAGWGGQAPLWFYVLKEAELEHQGKRLGPVGGRIVAEVLLGLLKHDATSFANAERPWKPVTPIAPRAGSFGIADLLDFAGVA